jgi:hypothetical protein
MAQTGMEKMMMTTFSFITVCCAMSIAEKAKLLTNISKW